MRAIDGDSLATQLKVFDDSCTGRFEFLKPGIRRARMFVHGMPTIDLAKHGRWIWADDCYLRCSECTQKAPVCQHYQDEPMTTATDYCPHCGAKMDL